MSITNNLKAFGITLATIAAFYLGGNSVSAQEADKPDNKPSVAKKEDLTLEQITELMKRDTVEDILKEEYSSGAVTKVVYDKEKGKTNFDDLVYQKESKEKKPVLVMFYDTKNKTSKSDERESIVLKNLAKKYDGKIKFVTYDVSMEPGYTGLIDKGTFGNEVKKEGIKGIPSIALYSTFDLMKGETPEKNDGIIKQVDVQRKGPAKDEGIGAHFRNLSNYWIRGNIFLLPNPEDKKLYRYDNSFEIHSVGDAVLSK